MIAMPSWRTLETHCVFRACSRARANTGKRIAARMAMIAITTSSSIRVKPRAERGREVNEECIFASDDEDADDRATVDEALPDARLFNDRRTALEEPERQV